MPALDNYLYFVTPCLPLRDIRIAINLAVKFGTREGFFDLLHTQRRSFDNYPEILKALKDFYGSQEKISGQEKTTGQEKDSPTVQVKKALHREKAFEGATQKEKASIRKIEVLFKGRVL